MNGDKKIQPAERQEAQEAEEKDERTAQTAAELLWFEKAVSKIMTWDFYLKKLLACIGLVPLNTDGSTSCS